MKREKVIGVLGGMGPEATIDLFQKILRATPAQKDQDHLRIIIDNNPKVPDRIKAIFGDGEDPTPHLVEMARKLEEHGADFIIMPCNTAHYFIETVKKEIGIPFVDMIRLTAERASQILHHNEAAGLLATTGTYRTRLYDKALDRFGIKTITPDDQEKESIMDVVRRIKAGEKTEDMVSTVKIVSQKLIKRGAKIVISGCTELPLIYDGSDLAVPYIDPVDLLARKAVELAMGNIETQKEGVIG